MGNGPRRVPRHGDQQDQWHLLKSAGREEEEVVERDKQSLAGFGSLEILLLAIAEIERIRNRNSSSREQERDQITKQQASNKKQASSQQARYKRGIYTKKKSTRG